MYPKFVLIMYSKRANTEMTIMKEEIYIHRFLGAGCMPQHAGPYLETSEMVRRQGEGEKGENDSKTLLEFS